MNINHLATDLFDFVFSRRNHVQGSVPGGNLSLVSAQALGRSAAQGLSDVDILQFALTLEHLESRMYQEMLVTGILTGKEMRYFQNFGAHEAAHVVALSDTLNAIGVTPNQEQQTYNFPPFNNRGDILNFARLAEETGVGAYQGAAAAIQNKEYLAAAGSIVQVEARHAAMIRLLIGVDPVPSPTTPSLSIAEVNTIVGPVLGA